jgi:putative glutamine amidotransferase
MVNVALTDPMCSPAKSVRYRAWIERWIPGVEVRVLSYMRDNLADLDACAGLVLSGGGDVNPMLYDRPDAVPMASEIDERRDAFEFRVIEAAVRREIPVLGICRGTQLFNVFHGGSLLPDIVTAGFPSHSGENGDRRHGVALTPGTHLHSLCGVDGGEVNSAHHQAIDRVGRGLRVAARSTDGVIEAIEWDSTRAPVVLVQWHPERMDDSENSLTTSLILHFASSIQH